MKPKILISPGNWDPDNYVAAVAAAGGDPHAQYLAPPDLSCDGLLLCGGDDVDPSCYGQENRGSVGIDLARD